MDTRKFQFLTAVIGVDGARALAKATSAHSDLEWATLPRVIMSWLEVMGHGPAYDAGLPGVDSVRLSFRKSEDAFTGSITLGADTYNFQNASLFHVAGAVAMSLGADLNVAPKTHHPALAKLGKSVDLLVRSRTLRKVAELEKTSWNVKQRRRYQFAPGADKPMTEGDVHGGGGNPSFLKKPVVLSQQQVNGRREAYARSIGLKPRFGVGEGNEVDGFPNAGTGNELPYNNTFDAAHETAHAVATPEDKTLGDYQAWLSARAQRPSQPRPPIVGSDEYAALADDYDDDDGFNDEVDREAVENYEEGAHHENVANATENLIDRRAGLDPHIYQSQYRSAPKGEGLDDEGVMDPKSGTVVTNPAAREAATHARSAAGARPKQDFFNQDIRDQGRANVQRFDDGARFQPNGHVHSPTGPDAAINARAAAVAPGGQKWATPARAGISARQTNAQFNKAAMKATGGAGGIKLPGTTAAAIPPTGAQAPTPVQPNVPSQVGTKTGTAVKPMTRGAAAPPKLPSVKPAAVKAPAKKPTLPVSKAEASLRCHACGGTQFKASAYAGCICFSDLRKSVTTHVVADGYVLEFGSSWDAEAIATLAETLGK